MALSLNASTRLLVVAPHPDDESIATGELIQLVRRFGGEVSIALLTNGDNNPWPQRWVERRLRIGEAERRRWGQRRRGEVGRALQQLGVDGAALHVLDWPDMGVTGRLCDASGQGVAALRQVLDACRPNLIALPALGDRHPDHSAAHVIGRLALAGWTGGEPELLAYLVHGHENAAAARVKLDSSVELHARKLAALACHDSQMALSGKRMRRLADRAERYQRVLSSPCSAATVLPWQPPAALAPWLHLMLADGQGVRRWPWSQAPISRDGAGRYLFHARPQGGEGPAFVKLYMNLPSPWIFDRWGWCEV